MMDKTEKMISWRMCPALLLIGICLNGYAEFKTPAQFQFSGTVVEPPSCTLNGGNPIEINFGHIEKNKADGKQIMETFDPQLKCSGSDGRKLLKMQISGTPSFTEDVLETTIDGLGIRFYQNSEAIRLRQWFNLPNPASSLVLSASPIIKSGGDTKAGDFTASATLMVTFQ